MSSKEQVFAEDMTEEMQAIAMESARNAFQRTYTMGNVYAQIAASIRQDFDDKDGKGWNCVVGRSFGAFVTHKIKTYIYFSVSTAARMSVRVLPPLKDGGVRLHILLFCSQVVPNVSILLWKGI